MRKEKVKEFERKEEEKRRQEAKHKKQEVLSKASREYLMWLEKTPHTFTNEGKVLQVFATNGDNLPKDNNIVLKSKLGKEK